MLQRLSRRLSGDAARQAAQTGRHGHAVDEGVAGDRVLVPHTCFVLGEDRQGMLGLGEYAEKVHQDGLAAQVQTAMKTVGGWFSSGESPSFKPLSLGFEAVDAAMGKSHSLLLSRDGNLYGMGSNKYFQLGIDNPPDCNVFNTPVPIFAEQYTRFKHVACAGNVSAALSEDGDIYTWGTHKYALGQVSNREAKRPVSIGNLGLEVERLCGGNNQLAALTKCGQVFTWGSGDFGKLGLGGTSNQNTPRQMNMESFGGDTIRDLASGGDYTMAITSSGRLFGWGKVHLEFGQTSLEAATATSLESPYEVDVDGEHTRVKQVAGSKNVVVVCTVDDRVLLNNEGGYFEDITKALQGRRSYSNIAVGKGFIVFTVEGRVAVYDMKRLATSPVLEGYNVSRVATSGKSAIAVASK